MWSAVHELWPLRLCTPVQVLASLNCLGLNIIPLQLREFSLRCLDAAFRYTEWALQPEEMKFSSSLELKAEAFLHGKDSCYVSIGYPSFTCAWPCMNGCLCEPMSTCIRCCWIGRLCKFAGCDFAALSLHPGGSGNICKSVFAWISVWSGWHIFGYMQV